MAPGLRHDTLARIDEEDREFCVRCPGRHIARVLFMSGRIGNNERTPRRREEPVGNVDRDFLFALRLQPVNEQGKSISSSVVP